MCLLASFALVLSSAIQAPRPAALVPDATTQLAESGWKERVYTIQSNRLGESLHVYVGLPPSHGRAERSYPALYLLDGQHYFREALDVVRALNASGQIPEMLLIGIESRDRRVDFTPAGIHLPDIEDRGRADTYLDFLEQELWPSAAATLHAGMPRVLLGHSHGGMLVMHALAARPEAFAWGIALDAPTHHEHGLLAKNLVRAVAGKERPALRLVSLRVTFGVSDEQWPLLRAAARQGDVLSQAKLEGETHVSMFFAGCYRGLHEIFADASAVGVNELAPLDLDEHYRELARAYGAEVVPPEAVMRGVVEDFLLEGRGNRAGEWLDRFVAAYGKPRDFVALSARIKRVAALGEPTETVKGLLALPRATPEAMKAHLGEWRGSTWMNEGRRSECRLRFWVENGVVQGEMTREEGPPVRCEFLRVRPDGALEFGHRNGMRPRALIVFEEKTPGGVLEGESVFRGIRLTLPDDEPHPVHRFEFTRVDATK